MAADGPAAGPPRACYLLPLRWPDDRDLAGLTRYLRQISAVCEVVVVDGSPGELADGHRRAWSPFARHLPPDPALACLNGKVSGVITGVRATRAERVVIADDDIRYDLDALRQVLALLDSADLVIPQNYFDPLPWHAAWDSARSLINRSVGMDYPGTLAVRRAAFLAAGCYDGDVLFENLELIRTLRAARARVVSAPQLLVRRIPPGTGHFARQRVRQAYDSLGQPPRLAAELALLPLAGAAAATGNPRWLGLAALGAIALAETGRRRAGGTGVFPARLSLMAPLWLAERSVCSWLAVACWLFRGGVGYTGHRLRRAATPAAVLRRRAADRATVPGPESGLHMGAVTERLAARPAAPAQRHGPAPRGDRLAVHRSDDEITA